MEILQSMNPLLIIFAAVFANNFILVQFLGICPFLGVSKKTDTALGMGIAVIFVMGVSSLFTFMIGKYILEPNGLAYMQTIVFILVIASLVQIIEMVIKKFSPSLYSALGVYLPLITTNCAVLGVAIMNMECLYPWQAFLNGTFSGVGFTLAIVLLAGIRERMQYNNIPKPFKGFPITLITGAIMSMAFIAFGGMI